LLGLSHHKQKAMFLVTVNATFYRESYKDFIVTEDRFTRVQESFRDNQEHKQLRLKVLAVSEAQARFKVHKFMNSLPSQLRYKIVSTKPFFRGYKFHDYIR